MAEGSQLDFETTSSYALTVEVNDSGTPGLTDTELITINNRSHAYDFFQYGTWENIV